MWVGVGGCGCVWVCVGVCIVHVHVRARARVRACVCEVIRRPCPACLRRAVCVRVCVRLFAGRVQPASDMQCVCVRLFAGRVEPASDAQRETRHPAARLVVWTARRRQPARRHRRHRQLQSRQAQHAGRWSVAFSAI